MDNDDVRKRVYFVQSAMIPGNGSALIFLQNKLSDERIRQKIYQRHHLALNRLSWTNLNFAFNFARTEATFLYTERLLVPSNVIYYIYRAEPYVIRSGRKNKTSPPLRGPSRDRSPFTNGINNHNVPFLHACNIMAFNALSVQTAPDLHVFPSSCFLSTLLYVPIRDNNVNCTYIFTHFLENVYICTYLIQLLN